ncbi:unnamed protein product [Boreogadus saida]
MAKRAAYFNEMELQVLLESYDEEKDIITRKGNAKASATRRTKAWQRIADRRGAAFQTFQKGPALYLAFPRGSAFQTFQTFQKGPAIYLVFADAGNLWVFAVAGLQTFFFVASSWLPSTHPIWI